MKIALCVFDMAGTTVQDTDHAVALRLCEALAAAGVKIEREAVNPVMGIPKPVAIASLLEAARGGTPRLEEVEAIHHDFQERIVKHYQTAPHVAEMPGASALFRELAGLGVAVGLDTGFDSRTKDAIIKRLGWEGLLDASIASDEVAHGRPHPDMIDELMRRTGVSEVSRVAKVGDSVSDLEQGVAAGCGLVCAMLCERTRPVMSSFPTVVGLEGLDEFITHLHAYEAAT